MAIDRDTARRVAHLARIEVTEADLDSVAAELSGILGFMDALNEVDVSGVEPMTSVTPMTLKWREDVVDDGGYPERVLANAPDTKAGFFAVPKVVE
jgi:aspartyl-tRNA(Asn)/glutamyl-tRNA(Gln) amidotransferase subunit C